MTGSKINQQQIDRMFLAINRLRLLCSLAGFFIFILIVVYYKNKEKNIWSDDSFRKLFYTHSTKNKGHLSLAGLSQLQSKRDKNAVVSIWIYVIGYTVTTLCTQARRRQPSCLFVVASAVELVCYNLHPA